MFARTDATRAVWKSPAGTEVDLVGVTDFAVSLTDVETDVPGRARDQLPAQVCGK